MSHDSQDGEEVGAEQRVEAFQHLTSQAIELGSRAAEDAVAR
jgi:hypothetical protein